MTRRILDVMSSVTANALDAELALMRLVSLGVGRYIARLQRLAEQDIATIAARVGPILDQYVAAPKTAALRRRAP